MYVIIDQFYCVNSDLNAICALRCVLEIREESKLMPVFLPLSNDIFVTKLHKYDVKYIQFTILKESLFIYKVFFIISVIFEVHWCSRFFTRILLRNVSKR